MINIKKLIKILNLISLMLILIGIILLLFTFFKKPSNKTINIEDNTHYKVILKDNPYYSNLEIKEDNYYIEEAIKKIIINYNLSIENEKNTYYFQIKAFLNSQYEGNLVWEKEIPLKEKTPFSKNIKDEIVLDYNYYLNYAKDFANNYHLSLDTTLTLKLEILNNNKIINYLNINIPLNSPVIYITQENNFQEDNYHYNKTNLSLALLFISSGIFILLYNKNYPFNNFKRLTKEYKDLIIKISNKPNLNNLKIIKIKTLEDLINIALSYNINILNYENEYFIIKENLEYLFTK